MRNEKRFVFQVPTRPASSDLYHVSDSKLHMLVLDQVWSLVLLRRRLTRRGKDVGNEGAFFGSGMWGVCRAPCKGGKSSRRLNGPI